MKTFHLPTLQRTYEIAQKIANISKPKDVLLLRGDLGAGKTEFARAFIRALTHDHMIVPSPTFTLVEIYETERAPIWHFDLYRLKSEDEIWDLGIEEAFYQGITLIEWPERLGKIFTSQDYLDIFLHLQNDTQKREVTLTPSGNWENRLETLDMRE